MVIVIRESGENLGRRWRDMSRSNGMEIAALAVVALLLTSGGSVAPAFGSDGSDLTTGELFLADSSASVQETENGANADSKASESESKDAIKQPKGGESKPPIGVCRESWIGNGGMPTYHCDVLFGPA